MTRVYNNITDPAGLFQLAKQSGLAVHGDDHTGIINGYGVTVSYEYSANNKQLTLVILHKSLLDRTFTDSAIFDLIESHTGLKG